MGTHRLGTRGDPPSCRRCTPRPRPVVSRTPHGPRSWGVGVTGVRTPVRRTPVGGLRRLPTSRVVRGPEVPPDVVGGDPQAPEVLAPHLRPPLRAPGDWLTVGHRTTPAPDPSGATTGPSGSVRARPFGARDARPSSTGAVTTRGRVPTGHPRPVTSSPSTAGRVAGGDGRP